MWRHWPKDGEDGKYRGETDREVDNYFTGDLCCDEGVNTNILLSRKE